MKQSTVVAGSSLALVVALGLGFGIGRATVTAPTTTTSTTTSTTSPPSTSSTIPGNQPAEAAWPFAATANRFVNPVDAARSYATTFLRFTNPVIGTFQQGDTRSGEVVVSNHVGGTSTTILVRQLSGDSSWWVLGSVAPDIHVTTPSALETITSPISLSGTSTAFEAVVNVELYQDNSLIPIAATTVMGGSMGMMGPFSGSFSFPKPTEHSGTLVFRTYSAKDGGVIEASSLRVAFAP